MDLFLPLPVVQLGLSSREKSARMTTTPIKKNKKKAKKKCKTKQKKNKAKPTATTTAAAKVQRKTRPTAKPGCSQMEGKPKGYTSLYL